MVCIEGELMQRILEGNHSYLEILDKCINDDKDLIQSEWSIYG